MSGWAGWREANLSALGASPVGRPAGNKYNAVRQVTLDGQRFDSKHEADIWQQLRAQERAGQITDLRRQRTFPLIVAAKQDGQPVLVGRYTPDFVCQRNGTLDVIDAKSKATKTEAYQLRKKLFEALYGLTVREL